MSEVKKIATRDSYGNALMLTWQVPQRPVYSRRSFLSVTGTAESQSAI